MLADSATWRSIREEFGALPQGDWSLIWTSYPPFFLPIQLQSHWSWIRPTDPNLRARASAIFRKAAKARGYGNEDQWLDELRHSEFAGFQISGGETLSDGTIQEVKSGILRDAVKHSIVLCHQLEAGDVPIPIALKLSRDAVSRMDAANAAFLQDFVSKLERELPTLENGRDKRIREAELVRELVVHHFETAAREYMTVCTTVNEFESELRAGIARFVHFNFRQYRWLSNAMRNVVDTEFKFFVMRLNPWTDTDAASKQQIGAIIGKALAFTALKLVAEATARAAEGNFAKLDRVPASEPTGTEPARLEESLPEKGAGRKAFVDPILNTKGWSIFEWATNAEVDFHTADDYLKGVKNPYRSTRKKLADALGVDVNNLPE